MTLKLQTLLLGFSLILLPTASQAGSFNPNNLAGSLPDDVASAAIKTFGIYLAHRPFQGANSIFGESALELNFEINVIHIGSDLFDAMKANGMGSGPSNSSEIAAPMVKVHIRKAISKTLDMGVSGLFYNGQESIGGDLKIVLHEPVDDEGVTTAIRLGYTYATASLLYLKDVHVYSPEFLISRRLDSAEPYLGVGARYIAGTISVPFFIGGQHFSVNKSGFGTTAYAFTGVRFKILGPKGFIWDMEGAYDMSGFSSLGIMFGVAF